MNNTPAYSVKARYFPKSMAFTWSGANGTLVSDGKSLLFNNAEGVQVATVPFHDMQKAWFDFGKKDYLRIKKTDNKSCFFILQAPGNLKARVEHYKALEQILIQNNLDSKNSLAKTATFYKYLQIFRLATFILVIVYLVFVFAKHYLG